MSSTPKNRLTNFPHAFLFKVTLASALSLGAAPSLIIVAAPATAQQADMQSPLAGGRWHLIKLDGKKIPENKYNIIPSILFDPVTRHVSGTGSCNRFVGKYFQKSNELALHNIVFTQKICMDETANQTEQALKTAFSTTRKYQLTTRSLIFLDEQGRKVAEFSQKKL